MHKQILTNGKKLIFPGSSDGLNETRFLNEFAICFSTQNNMRKKILILHDGWKMLDNWQMPLFPHTNVDWYAECSPGGTTQPAQSIVDCVCNLLKIILYFWLFCQYFLQFTWIENIFVRCSTSCVTKILLSSYLVQTPSFVYSILQDILSKNIQLFSVLSCLISQDKLCSNIKRALNSNTAFVQTNKKTGCTKCEIVCMY